MTSNPAAKDVCEGTAAQFTSSYTGPISSQTWQVSSNNVSFSNINDNSTYSGTKSTTFSVTTNMTLDNMYYRFYVANSTCGFSDYSTGAKLTVKSKLKNQSINPSGNLSVCDGSGFNLEVGYQGSPPVAIQWQKYTSTWTDLSGETGSIYSGTASLSDNDSRFQAILTQGNICNTTIETDEVTLNVDALPLITEHPGHQVKCVTDIASFSIVGSGEAITYKWQENTGIEFVDIINGGKYSGAGTNSLTISDLIAELNGYQYRCILSGKCPPAQTSDAALLTVNSPPVIDSISPDMVKCIGQPVDIIAYVKGTQPIDYRWRLDGAPITGWADLDTLILSAVGIPDAGKYDFQVKNTCEDIGITSDQMDLTVNAPPNFTKNPDNQTVCENSGTNVKFSATTTGGDLLLWQFSDDEGENWTNLENNTVYSGVATAELTIINPGREFDQNQYRCQAVGSCDPPVTTIPAVLTVNTRPAITLQPVNDTVCAGIGTSFTLMAEGTGPLEYKWKKGGKGFTDWLSFNSMSIDEVSLDDNGDEIVCLVRNECAWLTPIESDAALLKVNPSPAVSLGSDRHLCPGDKLILDPGSEYAAYNWSNSDLTRTTEVTEEGSYKLTVTDDKGCMNDDKVYVFLDPVIPVIDLGADAKYCKGAGTTLDVTSSFDDYTWSTGSFTNTINITSSGQYWVSVSNNNSICQQRDSVEITIQEPFDKEKICIVTVDLATGKNMVVWEKTRDVGTKGYHIYREKTIGNYELIAQVMNPELSIFKDTLVSPENQSYLYKITSVDTCGNESELDAVPYHKPIKLNYVSSDNGINLVWTNYEIQGVADLGDYLTSFEIYRGSDSTSLSLYKEVGSINNYTDTDPNALLYHYYYRVAGVLKDPCNPSDARKAGTGPYLHSLSNLDDNKLKEADTTTSVGNPLNDKGLLIYPNPFTDYTTVSFQNEQQDEFRMILFDITGKAVLVKEGIRDDEVMIHRNQLKSGYYNVVISGPRLYRGRLVIK